MKIYNFLIKLILPLVVLRLFIKSLKNPDYRKNLGERFGIIAKNENNPLWIHAVSVGEFLGIRPIVAEILKKYPDIYIHLSCTTPTGREQIVKFAKNYPNRLSYSYFPYDCSGSVKRFFNNLNPSALVLMETELWVNVLNTAKERQIPRMLINARLSAKSLRGYYRFLRELIKKTTEGLLINAQSRADAIRLKVIAPLSGKIVITPSVKWVSESRDLKPLDNFFPPNLDLILAASSHKGEEEFLITAFEKLREKYPELALIIAPRHPERSGEIAELIKQRKFSLSRRSEGELKRADIYLLDSLGELKNAFLSAKVAFIGGSLIKRGGHNPLEALQAGIPVCFGKFMFNFQAISEELLQKPFVKEVNNDLAEVLETLLIWEKTNSKEQIFQFMAEKNYEILKNHLDFIISHLYNLRLSSGL